MQERPKITTSADVLLATGSSGGTIAAVRQLAKSGIHVSLIASPRLCPAAWSRFVSRSYAGPLERDSRKFLDLLLSIGARSPGQVLLPTSDQTAWLYASNASLLEKHFLVHQPPVETLRRIMDKNLLSAAVIKAGLAVIPTWESRTYQDVLASAHTLLYPILIKPRTQVHRVQNDKGVVVYSRAELLEAFQRITSRERVEGAELDLPDARIPLLQHFVDVGPEGVHSVSGYIDQTGELFVTRHAAKILQRSLPAGVGVCFESRPANPELSESVRALCRELGYFGIFEVEFIRFGERWAVIDFNPRLFNQAGMDAHRGMPLSLMAYLDAAGRTAELRELVAAAQETGQYRPAVFYDRFTLWAILTAKTLTMRASSGERSHWRDWARRNANHAVDFALDMTDPMPGLVHAISETILGIKAFRRFLRSTSRIRSYVQGLVTKAAA